MREGAGTVDEDKGEIPKKVRYCSQCGEPLESGASFCYNCGCDKYFEVDPDSGHVITPTKFCPSCGFENKDDAEYCAQCGSWLDEYRYVGKQRPLTKKEWLIVALAIIPGVFNIFGLGHLCLRKISRGIMYLGYSVVLLYLKYSIPSGSTTIQLFIEMIGFLIYLKQAMEVFSSVGHTETKNDS